MKKLISILTLLALIIFSINAQEQEITTTDIKEEVRELKPKSKSADKFMITLTFDNLFHKENNGIKTQWHSRGIGIHYMYDVPIKTSPFSGAIGLGYSHSSYYHNSNIVEDSLGTRFNPINDFKEDDDFKRRKLSTNFIELPLEFRYRSKPDKNANMWKAAVGFKAGIRVGTASVEKNLDLENDYYKLSKVKKWQDVNIARVGPTLRVGYGSFNLFAFYSVTGLFKKSNNLDMTPFSIGFTITSF